MYTDPTLSQQVPLLAFLLPSLRLFTHVMFLLPLLPSVVLLRRRRRVVRIERKSGRRGGAALFRSFSYLLSLLSPLLSPALLMHLIIVGRRFRMLVRTLAHAGRGDLGTALKSKKTNANASKRSHFARVLNFEFQYCNA